MAERRATLASITARQPPAVAVRQVIVEKMANGFLVDPAQIESGSFGPSEKMVGAADIVTYRLLRVAALAQIPLQCISALLADLRVDRRNRIRLGYRVHTSPLKVKTSETRRQCRNYVQLRPDSAHALPENMAPTRPTQKPNYA